MKKNKNFWLLLLIFSCVFIILFIMNYYTPLFADDYNYSMNFATGNRIKELSDIFESQIYHYNHINGRFIPHILAQLFLFINKNIFNVINSIVFVLMGVLISYHINSNFKIKANQIILIYSSIFFFLPRFGENVLWITGSANYMYTLVFDLLLLIPIRKTLQGNHYLSKTSFTVYALFSMLVGNCSENNGIAILSFIILAIVMNYLDYKKINNQLVILLICFFIGFAFLMFSPGQSTRMESANFGLSLIQIIKNFIHITYSIIKYYYVLLFALICLLVLYYQKLKNTNFYLTLEIKLICCYLIAFLGSSFSLVISPQIPDRIYMSTLIYLIIIVLMLVKILDVKFKFKKILIGYVLFCFSFVFIAAFQNLRGVNNEFKNREYLINEFKNKGEHVVYLTDIKSNSKYSCFGNNELNIDETKWPNTAIAKYYSLDYVKKISD